MCGIVAVLQRDADRAVPSPEEILALVSAAERSWQTDGVASLPAMLATVAEHIEGADRLLRGVPGVRCLVGDGSTSTAICAALDGIESELARLEADLDAGAQADAAVVEAVNAAIVRVRDAAWAVSRDRVGTAEAVADLAGRNPTPSAVAAYTQIQYALSAIDRLEVRGRDSAGVHVFVTGHGLDPDAPSTRELLSGRIDDTLFRSRAARMRDGVLSVVYKAAAEIGELGDNTVALRAAIADDDLLRLAVSGDAARVAVLGHTRWASVGMISEANAHPVNGEEVGIDDAPYVVAALNGDVDNFADLRASEGLEIVADITTDAKVIPTLVSRRLRAGLDAAEAFRRAVATFEGSVAIASAAADAPDRVMLALRGSGQALYVGLAEDTSIVASEPYGLVEQCDRYLRMDGETPADPSDPSSARGQIVVIDASAAGTVDGIARATYDGAPVPVSEAELVRPEITTRDIDRGEHPHFLLKEITESPRSFRKTLRGKIVDRDGAAAVALGDEAVPASVRARLASGDIGRIVVIGQGTAAIAGRSLANALSTMLAASPVTAEAMAATELSGFRMRDDMSDTLVVAISQSGTTTDTNRTVEIARARGASVIAIVNRRQSDLVDRSDGVLYTSDGRDVEMAVPSTKAFYAQVAAGFLLACELARALGADGTSATADLLSALRDLPVAMERVLEERATIADIAQRHAPGRRYWAVVGNGANRVAAEEVRIKLSELCYKSIACDFTEDKKHIDLAAEPMIFVCAAGLSGSNAEDVSKEIAIYRAHKAAPVVVCSEGEERFASALDVIRVPAVHPELAFVLSAMAGHLFGYEAAVAIDAQARPLRGARARIEAVTSEHTDPDQMLLRLAADLEPTAMRFFEGLRAGVYNGHLEADTAVRLASLFRYTIGVTSLEVYQVEHGKIGTPSVVVEDLTDALTKAIDELTRPVDAIKHQAKTVTVGISRADESFLQVPLVREVLAAGVARDALSYRTLRALAALDPAVDGVSGYTHYRVEGDIAGEASVHVIDRGGIARDIPSRTERDPRLRGTKHRVAAERDLLVTRGRSDGRTVIIVPETKGPDVTGLALLHVRLHDRLPAGTMRRVLDGYRDRLAALRDLVTESEPTFREDLLGEIDVAELLIGSIQVLADRWRA